mmetsp:Transcript_47037/g.94259  ORF Transcript_47037/g.94259 Transcript_47037/m.94259 type:complete len:163 (-) Transcript_47037:16-504(-)
MMRLQGRHPLLCLGRHPGLLFELQTHKTRISTSNVHEAQSEFTMLCDGWAVFGSRSGGRRSLASSGRQASSRSVTSSASKAASISTQGPGSSGSGGTRGEGLQRAGSKAQDGRVHHWQHHHFHLEQTRQFAEKMQQLSHTASVMNVDVSHTDRSDRSAAKKK